MTDPNEYGTLFSLVETTGRQLVGFCVADENGPVTNSRGFVTVHNPLHFMVKLVRDQQGNVMPNIDVIPVNLVGWETKLYVTVSSYHEATGVLAETYIQKYKEFMQMIQQPDSLIQPAKEISQADIKAAEAVQRMKVK